MGNENKIGNSAIEQALMSIIDPFVSGIVDGVDSTIQENEKLKAENEKLKAENVRYRAALQHIGGNNTPKCCNYFIELELNLADHYFDVAREALKGGE